MPYRVEAYCPVDAMQDLRKAILACCCPDPECPHCNCSDDFILRPRTAFLEVTWGYPFISRGSFGGATPSDALWVPEIWLSVNGTDTPCTEVRDVTGYLPGGAKFNTWRGITSGITGNWLSGFTIPGDTANFDLDLTTPVDPGDPPYILPFLLVQNDYNWYPAGGGLCVCGGGLASYARMVSTPVDDVIVDYGGGDVRTYTGVLYESEAFCLKCAGGGWVVGACVKREVVYTHAGTPPGDEFREFVITQFGTLGTWQDANSIDWPGNPFATLGPCFYCIASSNQISSNNTAVDLAACPTGDGATDVGTCDPGTFDPQNQSCLGKLTINCTNGFLTGSSQGGDWAVIVDCEKVPRPALCEDDDDEEPPGEDP